MKSLLAIDIGNTQAVLGLFENHVLQGTWRFPTQSLKVGDADFQALLKSMPHLHGVIISSVVPSVTQALVQTLEALSIPVKVIDYTWPFSFLIKAESPATIGIDRLVNAEAAIRDYGFPCIVVDSGTATTICAISKNDQGQAEFLGGAIMPGLRLSMEALAQNTAQLFKVNLTPPTHAIGKNTEEALRSGLLLGHAAMIDGMIRRFQTELGEALPVIATGGTSRLLKDLLKVPSHFDLNLTLRGISYLYDSILIR